MSRVFLLGLAAFIALAFRFSPDWVAFIREVRPAYEAATSGSRDAIDGAVFSSHGTRGFHVLRQARDLSAPIEDSDHRIVRWRLFVPAVAHVLHLPAWLTLGIAHLGCLALVVALVASVRTRLDGQPAPPLELVSFGLVAGATAPLFTSMGWLGYYDSLLALSLLAVAYGPGRGWVVLAALLGPWIDERFVLGMPLALLVRWSNPRADTTPMGRGGWGEVTLPLVATGVYAIVRIGLGGTGGSQTIGQYLNQFVWGETIPVGQRLMGAWSGLGVSWFLVGAALTVHGAGGRGQRIALWALAWVTGVIGLWSALDMSRSMVLLFPLIPLGWMRLRTCAWWEKWRLNWLTAALALLLPAHQVVGNETEPVDAWWRPSRALLSAYYNLGALYSEGKGVPKDLPRSVHWYRKAAEAGLGMAQNNLGAMYAAGLGVAADGAQAALWYRKAAETGAAIAQNNLATLYAGGQGVPQDWTQALHWFRLAADQGYAPAETNLALIYLAGRVAGHDAASAVALLRRAAQRGYSEAQTQLGIELATGNGVARDSAEAVRWFQVAAQQDNAVAQVNLGVLLANGDGVPVDLVQAYRWIKRGLQGKVPGAAEKLAVVAARMSPQQLAEARQTPP